MDPIVALYFSLTISAAYTNPTIDFPGAIIPNRNMRNVVTYKFVLFKTNDSNGTAINELINVGNFLPYISPRRVTNMPTSGVPRENIVPNMAMR